ncbi:uncharacterized protein A4U43_C08F16820 [Asparagus officinalis]|nr:uncharacterized protein A4U43_C08F16820 [Asparagus officinalis]
MRIRYLQSVLNQDVCYFDTEVRTSNVVYTINADAVIVHDAISEKLGNFIHYMGTLVSSLDSRQCDSSLSSHSPWCSSPSSTAFTLLRWPSFLPRVVTLSLEPST